MLRLQDGVWYGGSQSRHGSRCILHEQPHYHPNDAGQLTDKLLLELCREPVHNSVLSSAVRVVKTHTHDCIICSCHDVNRCSELSYTFPTVGSFSPTYFICFSCQGLCRYLEDSFESLKERGVVIGYDARAHPPSGGSSKHFASLAAAVFLSRGVPVHLFSDITPTPFVVKIHNFLICFRHCMMLRSLSYFKSV